MKEKISTFFGLRVEWPCNYFDQKIFWTGLPWCWWSLTQNSVALLRHNLLKNNRHFDFNTVVVQLIIFSIAKR